MAWYKCGGGGALSETVLWTNPSPTSSFAVQNITLSEDINNYKYIKIYYRLTTSNSDVSSVIYDLETYLKFTAPDTDTDRFWGGILAYDDSIGNKCRRLGYVSATSVRFMDAATVGGTGTTNTVCIPTKVVGLK